MNEEAAFIAALAAEPSDRTAALVFADWLDERGDPRGPMLRIDAVRAWMAPEYDSPLPKLRAALETGKRVTEASKALALIGAAAVPELVALLTHEKAMVRTRAVKTLRLMGARAQAALPALLALVKDADRGVRSEAFSAATEIVKHGSVDTASLREALHDADSSVRNWASSLLGTMRAAGAVKSELAKGLDSPDAGERIAAIKAMSNLYSTTATDALCKALADSSVEVRRAAAKQLSQVADPRMTKLVEPLHKALADTDADVRSSVAYALGQIGPAAAVALPALLRLLNSTGANEGPRLFTDQARLLSAVARVGVERPEAFEAVVAALRDPAESVRSAAVGALSQWTVVPASAAPALLEFVRRFKSEWWRIDASHGLRALARITPHPPEVLAEFRAQLAGAGGRAVARVLGELGSAAVPLLPELIAAFRSGPARGDQEIAKVLAKSGDEGIAALVVALDPGPGTAFNPLPEAAVTGLNVAGPAALSALPALLARLRRPISPTARWHVLRAVAGMGPGAAAAVPDLMAMFVDELVEDPYNAVPSALEKFGPAVVPFVPKLIELLRQPARSQRHPAVLRLLTALIPHWADGLAVFRDMLHRATAGEQYEGEPLLRLEVARAAIRGLAALGPAAEVALPELARAYKTFAGQSAGDARDDVLDAYGGIGGSVLPDIRAALADSSWKMRLAAIKALAATGDTSAETVAALRALETDASSKVRTRAATVLKKMDTPKAKRK